MNTVASRESNDFRVFEKQTSRKKATPPYFSSSLIPQTGWSIQFFFPNPLSDFLYPVNSLFLLFPPVVSFMGNTPPACCNLRLEGVIHCYSSAIEQAEELCPACLKPGVRRRLSDHPPRGDPGLFSMPSLFRNFSFHSHFSFPLCSVSIDQPRIVAFRQKLKEYRDAKKKH
jgi:hypothetical protein